MLDQKGNASDVSNSSNNFRKLNFVENSSNLIQITPPDLDVMSNPTYKARKRNADTDYKSRIKIALRSCVSDTNFADPVDT